MSSTPFSFFIFPMMDICYFYKDKNPLISFIKMKTYLPYVGHIFLPPVVQIIVPDLPYLVMIVLKRSEISE